MRETLRLVSSFGRNYYYFLTMCEKNTIFNNFYLFILISQCHIQSDLSYNCRTEQE